MTTTTTTTEGAAARPHPPDEKAGVVALCGHDTCQPTTCRVAFEAAPPAEGEFVPGRVATAEEMRQTTIARHQEPDDILEAAAREINADPTGARTLTAEERAALQASAAARFPGPDPDEDECLACGRPYDRHTRQDEEDCTA